MESAGVLEMKHGFVEGEPAPGTILFVPLQLTARGGGNA